MALLTKYSLWLLPLVLLLGVGYAFFLYYKNNNIIFEKKHRIIMASLRGLAMSLLAFLLLGPMLKLIVKQTDHPVILLAIDNSESLRSNKDSVYYINDYPKAVQELATELGNKYEIKTFLVGDEARLLGNDEAMSLDFSEKSTNLASIFDVTNRLYANQNIGAMVLLTDGIYNTGASPYYKASEANFPVYTVGLGNTELTTDLFFSDVVHNKQAFKGNMFPVELKINANRLSGKQAELTVMEGDKEILHKNLSFSGNRYFETVKLSLEAQSTGVHHYRADLTELDGEVTHKNNHMHFYVEVIESRDKIAIVYNSPHPDVAALNEALALTDNYDVEVSPASEFKGNPSEYSLIVLHQLPSKANSVSNLISQIRKSGTSALYIIGTQTDLNNFNTLNTGLSVTQSKNLTNNAMPLYNENFTSFTFSEEAQRMLPKYPPIKTIFGTYKTGVSANVFMYQKISGVDTKYPLVVFNQQNGAKTGIITGTGFWQWKLYNYLYAENHEAFNEIMDKIALYLAAKGDKSQFRVRHADVFAENAPVEFSAELFNDSYELINEPDIKMVIKGSGDTTYEAQFSKQNKGYYLNMGELPVGSYSWTATTQVGGKRFEKSGRFSIQEIMLETANLIADHDLLKSISTATKGKFFTRDEIQKVAKEIKANDNIKSISSYRKKYTMLLNSPWYLAAIVMLLGIEWFLRKWNGGY